MNACTIIAKNYVAQARVLARSFLEHNSEAQFWTLIIDDFTDHIDPAKEPFEVLTPSEIGCEPFEAMAARYDVLELSTAVKPWLLRHLLDLTSGPITYLDPDIRIYGPLAEIDGMANQHGIVLTPHNTHSIPYDGERPSQVDILIAGVYNLGYLSIAANAETDRVIAWWMERLSKDCRVDPVYGYFVDQRWFDLVPGLVSDYKILRDPGYNLAYWNLHDHRLTVADGSYEVDGHPLRFFHFSGFDPAEPGFLSRHQTRIRLSEEPVLRRLCSDYAREVMAAGYREAESWPYSFDSLADGTRFTSRLRRLFAAGEDTAELSASPFTPEGARRFVEWLEETPAEASGLNRVLASIYQGRADLQKAYPDVAGADRDGFLGWVKATEHPDRELPERLLGAEGEAHPDVPAQDTKGSDRWGVNVVGYFQSELGVGEVARQVVDALDAAEVPTLPIHGRRVPPSRQSYHGVHLDPSDACFPINLICMNADMLPEFAAETAADGMFIDRYSIGMWFWELERFPKQWWSSFEYVNEVWAPTRFIADTLSAVSPIPVIHMPVPIAMPPTVVRSRESLKLPEDFVFLFMYDYYSVFERKNPLAVVEAFKLAFPQGAGASLALKCINADADPKNHERVRLAVAERSDVHLIEESLSNEEKNALLAACDCYVSLHRSEGFGLTMAEAMLLRKPVIATAYSGNLDFMNEANSYLVRYEMTPVGAGAAPYPPEGEWAQPDVEHAASLMRAVFERPAAAAARGRRAAAEITSTRSARVAGRRMARRLRAVQPRVQRAEVVVKGGDRAGPPAARIARGPIADAHRSRGSPRGLLRRLVMRLMRPFTVYQETLNGEVVEAIRQLDGALEAYESSLEAYKSSSEARRALSSVAILRGQRAERRAALAFQGDAVRRINRIQGDAEALMTWRVDLQARVEAIDQASQDLRAWRPDVTARVEAIDRASQRLRSWRPDVMARVEALDRTSQDLTAWRPDVMARVEALARISQVAESEARAIPYMEDTPLERYDLPQTGIVEGYCAVKDVDRADGYRSFEDVFRGAEQMVGDRQRIYVELIGSDHAPVLDFGCGRGEFLDLLRAQGIPYVGVDFDEGMVKRCTEKGHTEVVLDDGLRYLRSLDDDSLGTVFCAQVIEHFSHEELVEFLALSRRKLRDDGILIAETVNPHSRQALKTFWADLSHHHPIFPEVALILCRNAGFDCAYVFHPNGIGDVDRDRYTRGEYAVIGGSQQLLASRETE